MVLGKNEYSNNNHNVVSNYESTHNEEDYFFKQQIEN